MIKLKVKTKLDTSGLVALAKKLKNVTVDVGYINSPDHWMNPGIPVAQVAGNLHEFSPWRDTFMLTETKADQVRELVKTEFYKYGITKLPQLAKSIGQKAVKQIEVNIVNVYSPTNSEEWAAIKGFNDPLRFGSVIGQEPNLISELTYKVNT